MDWSTYNSLRLYVDLMGSMDPLFRNLDADELEPETTVIESLCMNCQENVSNYSLGCYSGTVLTFI